MNKSIYYSIERSICFICIYTAHDLQRGDCMTEVEKRRLKLLQEVRKNYSEKNTPPAIHPRYSLAYHSLYHNEFDEESRPRSTFFLRLMIAVIIFTFVFVIDYHKEEIANINSQTIVNELKKDLFSQ